MSVQKISKGAPFSPVGRVGIPSREALSLIIWVAPGSSPSLGPFAACLSPSLSTCFLSCLQAVLPKAKKAHTRKCKTPPLRWFYQWWTERGRDVCFWLQCVSCPGDRFSTRAVMSSDKKTRQTSHKFSVHLQKINSCLNKGKFKQLFRWHQGETEQHENRASDRDVLKYCICI